jgi:uncharacterized protein YndB with AHSA1/START domain
MTSENNSAEILDSHMEIRIAGSVASVWKALTDDIGAWWPDEFYAGGEPARRSYKLEARPGGRMYEEWEGGGGVLWATVVAVEPSSRLQVMGTTFPNWGGPSIWFGTWELKADGAGTILSFSESAIGRISISGAEEKGTGWQFLFGGVLKAFVEGSPKPEWKE